MALRAGHIGVAIVGGIGAVFLTLGLVLLASDGPEQEAERVASLTVFDPGSWKQAAAGTTVLLEGRIAKDTPAVFRDFVACRREKYAGKKGQGSSAVEQWDLIGVFAPPLALEGQGGSVALLNPDYELRLAPHEWRSDEVVSELLHTEGERASGFRAGDLVTVEGVVTEGGLRATFLFGGDASEYLDALHTGVVITGYLGRAFAALGSVLLALGAFIGWRTRRSRQKLAE